MIGYTYTGKQPQFIGCSYPGNISPCMGQQYSYPLDWSKVSNRSLTEKNALPKMEEKKEHNKMSIICMARHKEGILAFSDSRSTITKDGVPKVQNDDTQKVFEAPNFVLTAWSCNEIIIKGIHKRLSIVIKEEIQANPSHQVNTFIDFLIKKVTPNIEPENVYEFCFGYFNEMMGHYELYYVSISKNSISRHHMQSDVVWFGTIDFYSGNLPLQNDIDILTLRRMLEDEIEHCISMSVKFKAYSPIWTPIQSALFQK